MADRKPQDQDRYIVRFPDGMRERLKRLAHENGRSLNAQIIYMLEFAFEEMEMAANVYGDPEKNVTTTAFLRDEIRKSTSILKRILARVEDPDSDFGKMTREEEGDQ